MSFPLFIVVFFLSHDSMSADEILSQAIIKTLPVCKEGVKEYIYIYIYVCVDTSTVHGKDTTHTHTHTQRHAGNHLLETTSTSTSNSFNFCFSLSSILVSANGATP